MSELAKEMKIDVKAIQETFDEHNTNEKKQKENPDGGPFDAYGGGKAWDKWGKKFYHNLPLQTDDAFHVAIVTPVIHYCMGGLKINDGAEVMTSADKVIGGLYGTGEAAGGIH